MKDNKGMLKPIAYVIILIAILAATMLASMADTHTAQMAHTQEQTMLKADNVYAITGRVVTISYAQDTVTFEDSNGHLWEFYGVEDWELYDCVSAVMNSMGTAIIYDDEVVNVTYNAWVMH